MLRAACKSGRSLRSRRSAAACDVPVGAFCKSCILSKISFDGLPAGLRFFTVRASTAAFVFASARNASISVENAAFFLHPLRMSLFTKRAAPPEPPVEQQLAAEEARLLGEIRKADEQVATLRRLIEAFKASHMSIVNGVTVFAVSDLNSLHTLRGTWSGLCAEAARIAQERNRALVEWSELCSSRKEAVSRGS